MYYDTYCRLQVPESRIKPTAVTFHDIMLGRKAFPISKVTLLVTFGTLCNYRTTHITFKLLSFGSPYHCVLGG
jgi:hypothetical protein